MNVDRKIDLHVSVPDFGHHQFESGTPSGGGARQQQPDAQTRAHFESVLAGEINEGAKLQDGGAENGSPASMFSLLSGLPMVKPSRPERMPEFELSAQIGNSIERLMVNDGEHGQRQVRMELKDDLLPGVTVVIQELEGRLQVDFVCSVESSRLRLNQAAPEQARTLAERLGRDVLLRIQTDDDEDPCLLETLVCL